MAFLFFNLFYFILKDNDNRRYENCAITHSGGWWYNSCDRANLNGHYYYMGELKNIKVLSHCHGLRVTTDELSDIYIYNLYRVATAQGKQGIWLLIFPDRETQGIFYKGKIVPTWKILKILLLKWQQDDGAFLS